MEWLTIRRDGTSRALPGVVPAGTGKRHMICGICDESEHETAPSIRPDLISVDDFYLHFLTATARFRIGSKLEWTDNIHECIEWVPDHARHFVANCIPNYPYEIVGQNNACVGHVLLPEDLAEKHAVAEFAFMSYSWQFYRIKSIAQLAARCKPRVWRQEGRKDWFIVTCMMIETDQRTGFSERVALAKVAVDAWLASSPTTKWVVLG